MLIREFIDKYRDEIICEPSGICFSELEKNKVQKIQIIDSMRFEIDKL